MDLGRLGPHHLFGLQVLQRLPRQGPRQRRDPLDRPRELDQVRGQVRPLSLPEPPVVAARAGDARVPDRPGRVADDRQGPGVQELRGVGPGEVRRGRREALHEPVQLQGLGDPLEGDGLLLDRRARLGGRVAQGDRGDGVLENHRLGPEREVRLPAARRHPRPLEGRPAVPRRPRAVPQARHRRGRGEARDRVLRRNHAEVRQAADDPAARGFRVAPEARAGSRARGLAEAPLQPPLLGRRGPEAPVALGQELDLLSRTRRRRSTG